MNRRNWLRWGCLNCAACAGWAFAQADWSPPPRFTRPEVGTDEGGLWALMDREEVRLRRSPFRIRDEELNRYLNGIACKLGTDHCPDIRVYLMRVPYFNASMAPNGMLQIWSGLLLRVENEAQLSAVIAHEIGHYLQRHSVEQLRDAKSRAAFGQFMAMFGAVGLIGQLAALGGAFAFSREHEREADRISVQLMQRAAYDPREATKVWANLLDEVKATRGGDPSQDSILFATHPPSEERRLALQGLASGTSGATLEAEFREQLAPIRFGLLEDEMKRGRFDESVALLNRLLEREPGNAALLHFRGEARRQRAADGDAALALADFDAAVRTGVEPLVTYRSLGYLYRALHRPDEARAAWQRYLERAPDAPDADLIKQTLEEMKS
jgi:beta-barrel assembly-enhancing protease